MPLPLRPTRRSFLKAAAAASGAAAASRLLGQPQDTPDAQSALASAPLLELPYSDVTLMSSLHETQLRDTIAVLMALNEDSLLRPLRGMAGLPAPGASLGGWYAYDPSYDPKTGGPGFAPAHAFGQWVSALSRYYAITGDDAARQKVLRLNAGYRQTISPGIFENTRFPAYNYDKLLCGLVDAHTLAHDPDAMAILQQTTDTALPHLPDRAIPREVCWRAGKDSSYGWDESYTLPENLFLAAQRGAGPRYRQLAVRYLEDKDYFIPLANGEDPMVGRHAYSYVNALCSAMQAAMVNDSAMHLQAARHGFDLLAAQSYATGGWGPDEKLIPPESDLLYASLSTTHNSFETGCGSYAHTKLTRYLLRVTRDGRYGDSMERVIWNTVLGAKPLMADGRAFYYSDYNNHGQRRYYADAFPCCSGTLPQVAADYRINSYLRDEHGLFVVLYLPSSVRWTQDGAAATLTQSHSYPLESAVHMQLTLSRRQAFALRLRIPAWTRGSTIAVNGRPAQFTLASGFATIDRCWESGDRIDLQLPMENRLEPIHPLHPETVALCRGPLVLFPVGEQHPALTRAQLLAARPAQGDGWLAETSEGTQQFTPFTSIGDRSYATYQTLAG